VAPCGVKWRLAISGAVTKSTDPTVYDPTFRGLHYCTTWGDPGQFRNTMAMHPSHRDRNISYAPDPVHVYSAPGTYTATVYVFDDQGNWGTAQRTYTIAAVDDFFTADETILVATNGDYSGPPTVPVANRFASASGLQSRVEALLATGRQRVRLRYRGGLDFSPGSSNYDSEAGFLYEDSFGTGRARLLHTSSDLGNDFQNQARSLNSVSTNIVFGSVYNELIENGSTGRRWLRGFRRGTVVVTHNCDYEDWSLFYYPVSINGTGSAKCDVIFSDCIFSGGKTFMTLTAGPDVYNALSLNILGSAGLQSPGAPNGWIEENASPVRFAGNDSCAIRGSGDLVIEGSAFYTKANWAFGSTLLNGNRFDGAAVRWGSGPATMDRIYYGRTYFEGGISTEQEDGAQNPHNWLADKCTLVGTPCSFGGVAGVGKGGCWWQNCLIIMPNHVRGGSDTTPAQHLITGSPWGGTGSPNGARPVGVVNCTLVDLRQASRQPATPGFVNLSAFQNVTNTQNIVYAPLRTTPVIPAGGVTVTNAGVDALYDGIRLSWVGLTATLTGSVVNGASVDLPYPNDYYGAPTTQATFGQTLDRHCAEVSGVTGRFIPGPSLGAQNVVGNALTVQFLPTVIRVTNLSGSTWASGATLRVRLDRGLGLMVLDTSVAQPAGSLVLPYPNATIAVTAGAKAFDDFTCRLRPGGRANAPSGTDCQGALLPQ
jgi:hypothetical protein